MNTETAEDLSITASLEKAFENHTGDNNNDDPGAPTEPTADVEATPVDNGDVEAGSVDNGDVEAKQNPDGDTKTLDELAEENGRSKEDTKEPVRDTEAPEVEATDSQDDDSKEKDVPRGTNIEKAPGDWKPSAREHWKDLPDDVKQEIKFQESRVGRMMTESTDARKLATEFEKVVQPFIPMMQAAGANDPLQGIQALLGSASTLQMGTAQQKAAQVAKIVSQYGVDIQALDSALAGDAPKENDPSNIDSIVNQRVNEALSPFVSQLNERTQADQSRIDSTIDSFAADPKNEFFSDVRLDMAHILESSARLGNEMSLEDAYTKACQINPEISQILSGRQRLAEAERTKQVASQHKAAASSTVGDPGFSGSTEQVPSSIEGALRHAMKVHS